MGRFKSVTFFLVLLAFQLKAQIKNSKLDESNAKQAFEPSVAISMKDPKNTVVTSASNNVYYSTDGGLSWRKSTVEYRSGVSGSMIVVPGGKDSFFILHRTNLSGSERLVCHESGDGGKTWSDGAMIDDDEKRMMLDQRWQRVTTDMKGNLYTTWTQSDKYASTDTACHSYIYYSQSSDGKKWSTPVRISQKGGKCEEGDYMTAGSSPAINADGRVYAVWANNGKIFFDRSFDGGDMWLSTDLPIADQPGGWALDVPGHKRINGLPQVVVDHSKGALSGSLYVCWADQRNGAKDTDIWLTRSSNGGDNWTSPAKVTSGESGRQQYYPVMAIDQTTGAIFVVYYDREAGDEMKTDVYLAYSVDGGNKFDTLKISESPFTPSEDVDIGDYIGLTAYKGIVVPVWTRVEDGKTSIWTTTIKLDDLLSKAVKK